VVKSRVTSVVVACGLAFIGVAPSWACTVTSTVTGKSYTTIGAAIAAAQVVDWFTIDGSTGACNENVLIDNTHLRTVLQGMNGAVINGGPASPTVDARAKGVQITTLTINGGSRGIELRRNANAVFNALTVQNAVGDGIRADSMALAVVMGSTIQNNGGSGIVIEQLATGRIGANLPEDGNAQAPNTISGNKADGITVAFTSNAYIVGNTISGNSFNGISVQQGSSAFAAGNTINSNLMAGISVSENSSLDLADAGTPAYAATPNKTSVNNSTVGIYCISGGSVQGHLGSTNPLKGNNGQFGGGTTANTFESTCVSPASSLLVP
jgi:parallel beta-helix repeat protein